ncbi:F-box domain-containing protein [Mycena chlorophos]|uniref:F-box domain-containing protein n=1 Tax=Mycena chlorophos TaxID=658473 RepID=A0A8H6WIZ6_MYCCL|nr:F-box domain-containing protein [Mycena chlorophos]
MADTSLPDEIISEILSPALKVADDAFANNYAKSPFAKFTESTSAYLVVCKSWLRVATPLLYHVVVLRSKAQAKALANALAKNPDLGRFVKKLRVEGGFGPSMHTIIQHSPNITDLFLSLDILATDTTEGLCKGLPLLNPRRLIFQCEQSSKDRSNKAYNALVNVLKKCFQDWDQLIFFHAPDGVSRASVTNLCTILNNQKRLEVIVTASWWKAEKILMWFSDCPLREVRVLQPLRKVNGLEYFEKICHAKLKDIIIFPLTTAQERSKNQDFQPQISPSLNPFFTPLANESTETQDAIFSRILYFAMLVPERAVPSTLSKWTPDVSILRVCKRFHRVGLPHLYAHVLLSKGLGSDRLASALKSNPSLAACIRTIRLRYPPNWFPNTHKGDDGEAGSRVREVIETPSEYPGILPKLTTSFVRIFSATTNLRDVSLVVDSSVHVWVMTDIPVSRDAVVELAKAAGPTLRTLGISVQGVALPPGFSEPAIDATIFGNFAALETLIWKSSIPISLKSDLAVTIPKLSRLEVLGASDSFFSAFARMALPSLHTLELRHNITAYVQPFFEKHGSKLALLDVPLQMLETLDKSVLDLCPNLVELKIACFGSDDKILDPTLFDEIQGTSATLKKLTLSARWSASQGANRQMPDKWAQHIVEVPFAEMMPNLSEISLPGLEWPSVEREIAKHPWVRTAEALHASNISVSDRYQVKWRPRLKVGRGRR